MKLIVFISAALVFLVAQLGAVAASPDPVLRKLQSGVVRITDSGNRSGTGVVVSITNDRVFVLTVVHVVGSDVHPQVTFFPFPGKSFRATVVNKENELGNSLCLVSVERTSDVPEDIRALPLSPVYAIAPNDEVLVIGNPISCADLCCTATKHVQSTSISLDDGLDWGYSGGPILKDGVVHGVVCDRMASATLACTSVSAWNYLTPLLPDGSLKRVAADLEPAYVSARKKLKQWDFELNEEGFIEAIAGGQAEATQLFLVAHPSWAWLLFDASSLIKGLRAPTFSGQTGTENRDGTTTTTKQMPLLIPALAIAIGTQQPDTVQVLLRAGAPADRNTMMGTPLTIAAQTGNPVIVKMLQQNHASVGKLDTFDLTPLTSAVLSSVENEIKFTDDDFSLVSSRRKRSDGDRDDDDTEGGIGAIPQAFLMLFDRGAPRDTLGVLRELIRGGAEVNAKDGNGKSPLEYAVGIDNSGIVQFLIDSGAKAECEDLLELAVGTDSCRTAKALLDRMKKRPASSLLTTAISRGNTEMARLLIDKGAPINEVSSQGEFQGLSPLYLAVHERNSDLVALLADKGADANVLLCRRQGNSLLNQDPRYCSPLGHAIEQGLADVARLLIGHGGSLNANCILDDPKATKPDAGMTPLGLAVKRKDRVLVDLLIGSGADTNRKIDDSHETIKDCTALHMAVQSGDTGIADALIAHGANVSAVCQGSARDSFRDATPLGLASDRHDGAMVSLLLSRKADVNSVCMNHYEGLDGWTALHLAANGNPTSARNRPDEAQDELIQMLLAGGARINACCHACKDGVGGWTPLLLAIEDGNCIGVRTLLAHAASTEAVEGGCGWSALEWSRKRGQKEAEAELMADNSTATLGVTVTPVSPE